MPNILYDLVDVGELTHYVRAYDNEVLKNQFTLDRWLPNRQIPDLEYRIRQGTLNDVETAEYRAWDTPAPFTGRPGITRIRGEIPPVSRAIPLGEEEMLRLRTLDRGTNDPLINAIYDDSELMVRSVQARIELARGQLLTTGKVTFNENGLQIEADFGLPANHKVTPIALWTDTTNAKPLTDLLTWTEFYVDENGTTPGTWLMSQARVSNLMMNAEFRQAVAFAGTTPNRINRDVVDAVLAANGIAPISTYDVKVRVGQANGTIAQTSVLDPQFVLGLPPAGTPMGETFYGVTAESIVLAGKGLIDQTAMPGIVALTLTQEHPVQTSTLATAVALPTMAAPKALIVADVA
jgi:hypothetical protein